MKLISCICPSKRSIADLQRTIDNFLAQTYPCKELVILRPETHSKIGLNILLSQHERGGIRTYPGQIRTFTVPVGLSIGELRNVAMRQTSGSVAAFWDDDDISHPERLARSMAAIDAGASLVGSSRVIYEKPVHPSYPPEACAHASCKVDHPTERWLFDGAALKPTYLVGGTLVYRRELWERRSFEDVTVGEDSRAELGWIRDLGADSPTKARAYTVVDLKDESLYTARISADATSPKDTESPGWREL